MPILNYEEKRILIWGKTYPELSIRYTETVCTGGVTEDGKPVRLYPIPLRYLEGSQVFKKYQWIRAKIARDYRDPRPESHHIDQLSIQLEDLVPSTKDEWGRRASIVFKNKDWQFETVESLREKERIDRTSLGVVEPREILSIDIENRPSEDADVFDIKLKRLKERQEIDSLQLKLFEETPEIRALNYVKNRLVVKWLCKSPNCNSHKMQVLDWELVELQRKVGEQKAKERLQEICNLNDYRLKFFLGNIHKHPTSFTIVGLWYPKKVSNLLFGDI